MKTASITLDWRFEALCKFSRIHLQGIRDFNRHLRTYSDEEIKAWECEFVPDDDDPRVEDLIEQRIQIKGVLLRGQTLGILGLYSFLERHLNLVAEHLRAAGAPIDEAKRGGFYLEELAQQFHRVGIDMKKPPFKWNSLDQMRVVRNCIAHTEGWITEKFANKLHDAGLTVRVDTELGPRRQTLSAGGDLWMIRSS